MQSNDHRRCCVCGELSITTARRFIGGWFFIRCPNCQRLMRVDPQHGQRWTLLAAFGVIGAAAIASVAVTDQPTGSIIGAAVACALLYGWEFALTRRSPLESVTPEDAREFRRNWMLAGFFTAVASVAVAFAATRL